MSELPRGTAFGGYVVQEPLGRGGMGIVYRARDERRARDVALKVMARTPWEDERFGQRLQREARTAASVRHPNVVAVLESGEERGLPYLVLELVTGGSLEALLRRTGRLPWPEVARLGAGIARGLAAVHAAGLVHRDVKPANVLLDEAREPKLSDFGLVRRSVKPDIAASAALTQSGEFLGTPEFASPEQAKGAQEVDARADLYSLGATLFALLTGRPPFTGTSAMHLMRAHLVDPPPPVRSFVPDAPEELDALIARLLAKEPAVRGSAAQVAEELAAIAALRAKAPPGVARSALTIATVVATLVLVAGVALGVVALREREKARSREAPPPAPLASPPSLPTAPPNVAKEPPRWFAELPAADRPPRVPETIELGPNRNEYVLARPCTPLVYVPARITKGVGFFIGKYEVTCAEFERFVAAKGYVTAIERNGKKAVVTQYTAQSGLVSEPVPGAYWRQPIGGGSRPAGPRDPVTHLVAADVRAFCAWAGGRLPTPDEWKIAALHDPATGALHRFPWGDDPPRPDEPAHANLRDCAFYKAFRIPIDPFARGYDDGFGRTAPVGDIARDASPLGLRDVIGNVSELCEHEVDGKPRLTMFGLHWARTWPTEGEKAEQGLLRPMGSPDENFAADNAGFRICVPE